MAILYVWSGAAGSANGSSWANAKTTLVSAFATEAAGDTLYVAHDHAESTAGFVDLTSSGTITNPTKVVCVDRAGSVPPISADRRATATVTTTGANAISIAGHTHYDGIIFNSGTGASAASLSLGTSAGGTALRFDNCSLRLLTTSISSQIALGSTSFAGGHFVWNNTTVSFANATQTITAYGILKWTTTASAVLGTLPTILFSGGSGRGLLLECIGVDLSALTSGKTLVSFISGTGQSFRFLDCKLDAAVTKATVPQQGSGEVDFIRSGATGVNYTISRHRISGVLTEETTIVRTGGASDGTTPIAWKIVTTANCTYSLPFECPSIAIWNDTTGSAVTATVEGIGATLPTDAEVWLDVEYLGDASSPRGSFVNDGKADLIATAANQTSSSETWGGSTAPFKLAVTFTAQQAGWIYARVKVGKASSTLYIDPKVTLS